MTTLAITCSKLVQCVTQERFSERVALIDEDFYAVRHNFVNILLTKATHRINQPDLLVVLTPVIIISLQLHGRYV